MPIDYRSKVLLDHRTYTVRPGTLALQLKLYEEYGRIPQVTHLGEPVVFLITETGELNTYIHIWRYQDAADRATRRAAMSADPAWKTFLQKSAEAGYVIKQENKLMIPAAFFPLR